MTRYERKAIWTLWTRDKLNTAQIAREMGKKEHEVYKEIRKYYDQINKIRERFQ